MKLIHKSITGFLFLAASFFANAENGVEINFLGTNNTLVRITGDEKYILLPIQDSNDDAKINVIVDGTLFETIYAKLSKSKTDFYVPYEIDRFKGKNVILDVVTFQGRSTVREAKTDACWKDIKLSDNFDTTNRELQFRPAFHHTPLYGWMNDPNGMFYKDSEWHLFYQLNPYGSKWQNMTWGHSSSKDLIHWEHQPIAIRQNALGTVFSGSSVIDHNNTAGFGEDAVIALYTSAGTSQMQSLAYSNDNGKTFSIYNGNPILTLETEARDPNMFWNEYTKEWNLVLAHALEHEIIFFTSPDLKNWTLSSSFGKGEGAQDGVWECPDLFELPVQGTDQKKWVLIVNLNPGGPFGGSATQYFIGDFDGKTFTADKNAEGIIPTKWLDYGKDHYATVSWSDAPSGRRVLIGWMSNWQYAADVPTLQFRSANTLPRDITLFQDENGEIFAACSPSPELLALRGKISKSVNRTNINTSSKNFTLPSTNGSTCEILLDIDAAKANQVNITLSNKNGEKSVIEYNREKHTLLFDRTRSGITDFSTNFPAITVAPTFENTGKISLRIFIDRSSIEIFGNDGKTVMTNLVFPNSPYTNLKISSEGGKAVISNFRIFSIKEQ
ncbi:MAG: GH32 C-terminal domain-containing protein [Muribaculaceae bacterium]